MKNGPMIAGFTAVALLAAAITLTWSHSVSADRHAAGLNGTSQQLHGTPGANKLPVEDFEDMSLVYSTPPKH